MGYESIGDGLVLVNAWDYAILSVDIFRVREGSPEKLRMKGSCDGTRPDASVL